MLFFPNRSFKIMPIAVGFVLIILLLALYVFCIANNQGKIMMSVIIIIICPLVLYLTFISDKDGMLTKLQPNYIIYITDDSAPSLDCLAGKVWENSKRVAAEFDIPILIINRDKIKRKELEVLETMSKSIFSNYLDRIVYYKKIVHFKARYGEEALKHIVSNDEISKIEQIVSDYEAHLKKCYCFSDSASKGECFDQVGRKI